MTTLSIYKASAGSGKTFRLTVAYLKIVLTKPISYRKILAITFTNKATAEMKSRILEQLHALAQGEQSAYMTILTEELALSTTLIMERAQQAEQYILHDYGRFSVMTIDAFFQTILKAFAKDLGIAYNYNVELDAERIKRLAVERLFEELDENTTLRRWLQAYVEEKINASQSWNITKEILTLSKELFQENVALFDKEQFKQWSDKDFVHNFSNKLQAYIKSYQEELFQQGALALELLNRNNLDANDFSYKMSGVGGLFTRLYKGEVVAEFNSYHQRALDNPEKWYAKTAKNTVKQSIEQLYPELNAILRTIHELITQKGTAYQSCVLVRKNLYMMGIFADIAHHIYEVLQEEEKILLSESNRLLYEMIAHNEVPFIYEKTGNQYLYFLWDEFQDTSQIQWHNLKPLLANALAEGNSCLIVGDIKQAIYRWRNSDWKILAEQVQGAFPRVETLSLQQNWRSASSIVAFNNELYTSLPQVLETKIGLPASSITSLYEDVEQETMRGGKEKGFVYFSYLENDEELKKEELVFEKLVEWVEHLQQKGVVAQDITFLVRENRQATAIADFFANYKERKQNVVYEVVSEYALLLQNAFVVKVLINALYLFQTQELYYEVFLEKLMSYLPEGISKLSSWKQFLLEKKWCSSVDQLVQQAVLIFDLHELGKEQLYLMAFEEIVNDFVASQHSGLADFLATWEDQKNSFSITPGERIAAMQVMTIHKAKGLEFHTVILPLLDKNLEGFRNGETLWEQADFYPLDGYGPLLLPFSKKSLLNSSFSGAYKEEMRQRIIDELNVFYVATTRAAHNLIMLAPSSNKGVKLSNLIYEMIDKAQGDNFWEKYWEEDLQEWKFGSVTISESHHEAEKDTPIYKQEKLYYQNYLKKFPLQIASADDFKRAKVDTLTPIEEGKIWHRLLEKILYIEDIPKVIRGAYYSGLITKQAQQSYASHLHELLSRKTVSHYYTRQYKIWNERPLWTGEEMYVPDRVVYNQDELIIIEYKFGESQTPSHKEQLQKYKSFFSERGYFNVKGCLIYGIFSEIIIV